MKFVVPTSQVKAWMDAEVMDPWFKNAIMLYTKGRRSLLVLDSCSTLDFFGLAKQNNVDVIIIPGGCTPKLQPLDVCLNKPFKNVLRSKWLEYMDSMVIESNLSKLKQASKPEDVQ